MRWYICTSKAAIHGPLSDSMNFTSDDQQQQQYLADELQGEFCYVQTSDGKIVAVHYDRAENEDAVNIKRSIASTFQANFDGQKADVEEADAGSLHVSHYTYVNAYIYMVMKLITTFACASLQE